MKQSETITKLLSSMVEAQSEFPTLPKDKNGYGYKYTDLDTVISTVKPILSKHGLAFVQSLTTLENGMRGLSTRLFCKEGEWLEDTIALPDVAMAKTNAAQNLGASITYMKRYALCAVLGISSDEDTDAVVKEEPKKAPTFSAMSPEAQAERNKWYKNKAKPTPAPKESLAGGDSTPQQKDMIKDLLEVKDDAGNCVFSLEEKKNYCASRKTVTAVELINTLTKEASIRQQKANEKLDKSFAKPEPKPETKQAELPEVANPEDIIF